MEFSSYSYLTVQMAVDLVNTRNPVDGADVLTSVEELEGFLGSYRGEWHEADWQRGPVKRRDLSDVRRLRERLRQVFHVDGEREASRLLNELLAEVSVQPRISLHGGDPHLHFEPSNGRLHDWLGAATAMGLSSVLVEFGFERFGVCRAVDCEDVFIDSSKNRSRRHCSTTCTTRENVAAHRRRVKERSG